MGYSNASSVKIVIALSAQRMGNVNNVLIILMSCQIQAM